MATPERFVPEVQLRKDSPQPLYAQVAHEIQRDLIQRGAPEAAGLPSERDLCDRLQVSRGTVRKALSLLVEHGVAELPGPRRQRVVSSRVRELRRVSLPRSIGIVVLQKLSDCLHRGELESLDYAAGIVDASAEHGQSVTFINMPEASLDGAGMESWYAHLRQSVFGVVHFGVMLHEGEIHPGQRRMIHDLGFPQVFLAGMSHLRHVASVWGDGRPGLVSAMEHLRELGHRRIGMITVTRWPDADAKKPFVQAGTHRQQHIIGSLKEAGLETRESWIAGVSKDLSEVHAAVDRVLSSRPRPTALFCQNDFMAEAIARCLRERGVVVPRDMSLVGYDDSRIAARCDPPLTTVRQPRHTVGRKCFELLDALREKGGSFDGVEERVRTSLVIRASTGQAAQEVLPG